MWVNYGLKLHDVIYESPLNENFSQFHYGKQMFKRKMFLCLTTLRSTTFRSYHFLPNPFQVLPLLGLPRTRPVDAPFIIVDLTFWRFTYWRLFNIVFKIKLFLRKKTKTQLAAFNFVPNLKKVFFFSKLFLLTSISYKIMQKTLVSLCSSILFPSTFSVRHTVSRHMKNIDKCNSWTSEGKNSFWQKLFSP